MASRTAVGGIDARLTKIEGQIRGIRSMADDGRDCIDVVAQIAAVRGALKKVADLLVADHVEQWVSQVARRADDDGRSPDVEELLKVFSQYYR
jgi:DNA-binding FrmR family transcriptional regulator